MIKENVILVEKSSKNYFWIGTSQAFSLSTLDKSITTLLFLWTWATTYQIIQIVDFFQSRGSTDL